jgi:hypothetical protein
VGGGVQMEQLEQEHKKTLERQQKMNEMIADKMK